MGKLTKILSVLLTAVLFMAYLAITTSVMAASSPNFARATQSWCHTRWHGRVQIQASFNDNGRHARQGWHRFRREAGPPLDTGWQGTPRAASRLDSAIHSHEMTVWDSPFWGDRFVTRYNWNFDWF